MGKVYLPRPNGLCCQEGFEPNLGEVSPSAGSVGPRSGSAITPSHREPLEAEPPGPRSLGGPPRHRESQLISDDVGFCLLRSHGW